jgi:tight adherence protein B
MNILTILVAVLAFVMIAGVGLVFAGGNSNGRTVKRAQALGANTRTEKTSRVKNAAADAGARRKQLLQTLKEQERRQRKASLTLGARLQQAGLNVSIRTFWILSACVGLFLGVIPLFFHGSPWIALGVAFVAGLGLPRWVVGFLAKRRTKAFTESFSDAIDVIVRGIKSGLPVHDCLRIISHESPAPLGPEFQRLVENLAMGVTMDQALDQMFERMPTSELRFFTIVLAIQAKTGGNLAEALSNLSQVLRGRKLMREKIKALSSEAKASAWIIGCLPPAVILLIAVTTPSYMAIMVTDPRGQMMLLGGALWMLFGILVMRRMINFKF